MHTYAYTNLQQTQVLRSDGAIIPWPATGFVHDVWVQDGSPTPTAHVVPPVATTDVDNFASARLAAGFADATTGKTWQCDDGSILSWTALAATAGIAIAINTQPVPSFPLIAADNSVITLTAPQLYALFPGRIMPWVSATVLFARTMKDNILAGNPPADITVGWP
jgi:hypothetical protein